MKEVLVTGGAGFIGSHLVEELIKNKNYKITIVDTLSTGKMSNIKESLFSGKVFLMINKIQQLKYKEKFDIIYHLGAKADVREKGMEGFVNNAMATEAVTKMLKPNGHFYFTSSCVVYGDQRFVTEESPLRPTTPYGYSKWMNELIIKDNCKNYTIFRCANVFGERNRRGLISIIGSHIKNNKVMQVFNQGEDWRDYIYVKDVVKVLTAITKKGIFNIGQNQIYNTLDLVKLSGVKWVYGAYEKKAISVKVDNTKLKKEGWNPTLTIIQYIKGAK